MEIGWTELLVIGIVALIVIGPKDLPGMFRELGRFTAKMRQMGREFSRAMEAAAKETGVNEIAADLKGVTSARSLGLDAVKGAADKFEKWDPLKNAARPTSPAAVGARSVGPSAAAAAAAAVAETAPAAVAAVPPVAAGPDLGPETLALAEKVAARKAIADEAAARLRALDAPPETVATPDTPAAKAKPRSKVAKAAPVTEDEAAPKVKRGGRTRKAAKPDAEPGETA